MSDIEFEEVGSGPMHYKKFALWERGDTIQGKFLGFKHDSYKGKPTKGINLKVTEAVDFKDYRDQEIPVGSTFSMPPAAILNGKVEEYENTHGEGSLIGRVIRIEYLGKGTTKAGDEVNTFSFKAEKCRVMNDLDEL